MLNTLIAVVLVAVSIGLLFYLARLLWQALRLPLGALLERRRLERYLHRARRGDRYLEDGAIERALGEFKAAFYPYLARSRKLAEAVNNHHTGLLSRLIAAADQLDGERVRLMSLVKVDRLFNGRRMLQNRYLTLRKAGYSQRLGDVERAFSANTRDLRAALDALVAEITAAQKVQYH